MRKMTHLHNIIIIRVYDGHYKNHCYCYRNTLVNGTIRIMFIHARMYRTRFNYCLILIINFCFVIDVWKVRYARICITTTTTTTTLITHARIIRTSCGLWVPPTALEYITIIIYIIYYRPCTDVYNCYYSLW